MGNRKKQKFAGTFTGNLVLITRTGFRCFAPVTPLYVPTLDEININSINNNVLLDYINKFTFSINRFLLSEFNNAVRSRRSVAASMDLTSPLLIRNLPSLTKMVLLNILNDLFFNC